MRQPDHVSPELGAKLKAANLQWEPAEGDWCYCEGGLVGVVWSIRRELYMSGPGPAQLRVSVPMSGGSTLPRMETASRCTWLPTTGQLMQELEKRDCGSMPSRGIDKWVVSYWSQNKRRYAYHPELPEAVGHALLAVLESQEEKGKAGHDSDSTD